MSECADPIGTARAWGTHLLTWPRLFIAIAIVTIPFLLPQQLPCAARLARRAPQVDRIPNSNLYFPSFVWVTLKLVCVWRKHILQGSAKRWALGCVNLPPPARGSQEAGFTQPRARLLAESSTLRQKVGFDVNKSKFTR